MIHMLQLSTNNFKAPISNDCHRTASVQDSTVTTKDYKRKPSSKNLHDQSPLVYMAELPASAMPAFFKFMPLNKTAAFAWLAYCINSSTLSIA